MAVVSQGTLLAGVDALSFPILGLFRINYTGAGAQ